MSFHFKSHTSINRISMSYNTISQSELLFNKTNKSESKVMAAQLRRVPSNPHYNNVSIEETARLTITMTVESRSKRKTVYRAVQRPDGIIVEKPRYCPSSSYPPELSFQRRQANFRLTPPPGLTDPIRGMKRGGPAQRGGRALDGRTTKQLGRDGYNEPFEKLLKECEFEPPLQRFINDSEPWNVYARRSDRSMGRVPG